jgi:hypothetical protein
MKNRTVDLICLSGLLAVAFTAHTQSAPAAQSPALPPPAPLPTASVDFDSPPTASLVLEAHGEGVQIYTCQKDSDWAWKLKAPDATLFDQDGKAIGKHFAGPTWRLNDGSEVQGKVLQVRQQPGTIPWLILSAQSIGAQGRLSQANIVRRTQTSGGLAPSSGCDAEHAGAEARIPYSATYSFFNTKQ